VESKKWKVERICFLIFSIVTLFSCKSNNHKNNSLKKKESYINLDSINKVIHEKDSLIATFQNEYFLLYESCRKENQDETNSLYTNGNPVTIKNSELISFANASSKLFNWNDDEGYYKVRVVSNGPTDSELPYCNTSHHIYIATSTGDDLPHYEYLYKIGPFMECEIEKIDQKNRRIYFKHLVKNKTINQIAEFSLTNSKIIN
jgi:hypothetical protein